MNVTITQASFNKKSSQKHMAFSATLNVDGKRVAYVSNYDGKPEDTFYWSDQDAKAAIEAKVSKERLAKWIRDEVMAYHALEPIKSFLHNRIIGLTSDGKELHFLGLLVKDADHWIKELPKQYPGITILNKLSDEDLLDVVRKFSRRKKE